MIAIRINPPPRLTRRARVRGTATIEFALVFPVLLVLALLLTQVTLVMGANIYVNYAAFAAARAAIVQVPTSNANENVNVISNGDGSIKREAIRRAAVYALVPVAGQTPGGPTTLSDDYVTGLHNYFIAYDQPSPAWIDNFAAARLRYADANTQVSLSSVEIDGSGRVVSTELSFNASYTFGPKDPIMTRVTHRLHLSVPYVNALFADGSFDESQGGGRYRVVSAYYVLTNEGLYDDLPPRPEIPRVDVP